MDSINKFLEKYKLIQYHEFELDISKEEFMKVLSKWVKLNSLKLFSIHYTPFFRMGYEYFGILNDNLIKLMKYPTISNNNSNSISTITLIENQNRLCVKCKFNIFTAYNKLFLILVTLFLLTILFTGLFYCMINQQIFSLFTILLFGSFIVFLLYYNLRHSNRVLRNSIEKDFKRYVEIYKSEILNNPK